MYDMLGKNIDLSASDGSSDGGRIWIYDHIVYGENQRWNMVYVGNDGSGPAPEPATTGPTQVSFSCVTALAEYAHSNTRADPG